MRKNRWRSSEVTHGSRTDKEEPRHGVDSQLALVKPRCQDEPRPRVGYTRDMDKYVHEHNRLFTMDHFSPYGPWPSDFSGWNSSHSALFRSPKGTTTMDATIGKDSGKPAIVIRLPERWEFYPDIGERIVVSRCHPALDSIALGPVAKISNRSFTIEWKAHWEPFEDFAGKLRPKDKRCPTEHFRVDLEIEAISTTRVDQALRTLTCAAVRGMGDHNVTIVTPLQALLRSLRRLHGGRHRAHQQR